MSVRFHPQLAVLTMLLFVSAAWAQPKARSTDKKEGVSPALLAKAKAGDAGAQYQLGRMYYMGEGVRQDYTQAEFWFRKGAEQGDPNSQFQLGGLYHFGQGVPHDEGIAFAWTMKAAKQGHGDAEFYISTCYSRDGWGVAKDNAQTIAWLRKGAEQGHLNSQFYLGWAYDRGEVIPQDYSESYFWLALAATQNVPDREKRADIVERRDYSESRLTQSELSNVRMRLQKWVQDHPAQSE